MPDDAFDAIHDGPRQDRVITEKIRNEKEQRYDGEKAIRSQSSRHFKIIVFQKRLDRLFYDDQGDPGRLFDSLALHDPFTFPKRTRLLYQK